MALTIEQQDALNLHNKARHEEPGDRPDLVWSNSLAAAAEKYAQKLAAQSPNRINLVHSKESGEAGENLAGFPGGMFLPFTFAAATQLWFDEIRYYSGEVIAPGAQGKGGVYGHYTQMVWPTATKVGIGSAKTPSGCTYIVARYDQIQRFGRSVWVKDKQGRMIPGSSSSSSRNPAQGISTASQSPIADPFANLLNRMGNLNPAFGAMWQNMPGMTKVSVSSSSSSGGVPKTGNEALDDLLRNLQVFPFGTVPGPGRGRGSSGGGSKRI